MNAPQIPDKHKPVCAKCLENELDTAKAKALRGVLLGFPTTVAMLLLLIGGLFWALNFLLWSFDALKARF